MTTLIHVFDGEGRTLARCDSRCYNATRPGCDCCCGGLNHGVGINQAARNTLTTITAMLDAWQKMNPDTKPDHVGVAKDIAKIAHPTFPSFGLEVPANPAD